MPPKVNRLSKAAARAITSSQVITSLASVAKELVDNAIDAGASAIDVVFANSGVDSLTVCDNGSGIALDDDEVVASLVVSRSSSKAAAFIDALAAPDRGAAAELPTDAEGRTLGFRGEALHSLATLASLAITSKTKTMPAAVTVRYAIGGEQVEHGAADSLALVHAHRTSVTVSELFARLPVRRQQLVKQAKPQLNAAAAVLRQLAVAHPAVRFHVSATAGEGSRSSVIFATKGSADFIGTVADVHGGRFAAQLLRFRTDTVPGYRVDALVSKLGEGRATTDMQSFSLDGRPVDLPRLSGAIGDCFIAAHPSATTKVPVVFMALVSTGERVTYDANVAPNKRAAVFEDELAVVSAIRRELLAFLTGSLGSASVGGLKDRAPTQSGAAVPDSGSIDAPAIGSNSLENAAAVPSADPESPRPAGAVDGMAVLANAAYVRGQPPKAVPPPMPRRVAALEAEAAVVDLERPDGRRSKALVPDAVPGTSTDEASSTGSLDDFLVDDDDDGGSIADTRQAASHPPAEDERQEGSVHSSHASSRAPSAASNAASEHEDSHATVYPALRATPLRVAHGGTPLGESVTSLIGSAAREPAGGETVRCLDLDDGDADGRDAPTPAAAARPEALVVDTFSSPQTSWARCPSFRDVAVSGAQQLLAEGPVASAQIPPALRHKVPTAATRGRGSTRGWHALTSAAAENDLRERFTQAHFERMEVLGQFNDGFIIGRVDDELFVLDQHASDEKHTFETLRNSYRARPQPLVAPVDVVVDEAEADAAYAHEEELARHGFRLASRDERPGVIRVASVPVLAYDKVTAADVLELTRQLREHGAVTTDLRAVWHSLATKACRTSIMIGRTLDAGTMRRVVRNMAGMRHPWNCPHGRPTMRHVAHIDDARPCDEGIAAPDVTSFLKRHRSEG